MKFAEKLKQAFAQKATPKGGVGSDPSSEPIELADREIPSVNARRRGNKVTSMLGMGFIACMGLYLIYQLNSGDTRKEKLAQKKEAEIAKANAIGAGLPQIVVPDLPAEKPASDGEANTEAGFHLAGGSGAPPERPPTPADLAEPPGPPAGQSNKPVLTPLEAARMRKQHSALTVEIESESSAAKGTDMPDMAGLSVAQSAPSFPSPASAPVQLEGLGQPSSPGARDELDASLQPTTTRATAAGMLPDLSFMITKGAFMDCTLETRIDSTVPGMTSCVLSRPMYSANRKLVLLDAGSKMVGQYAGGLKQGQARIFVLWTRIETPQGVVINLDSPGTDALGGGGLPGYVDTHFWKRFGGAILLSLVDDALAIASHRSGDANTTINLGNSQATAQNMATEALKASINIPPTLRKNHGDQINVFVARDLDFRSVYGIRAQ